jgi:hypothetical protein
MFGYDSSVTTQPDSGMSEYIPMTRNGKLAVSASNAESGLIPYRLLIAQPSGDLSGF